MSFSYLMNLIIRGQWFIAPQGLQALYPIIHNMIIDRGKMYDSTLYSSKNPLEYFSMSESGAQASQKSTYADAPQNSVAIIQLGGTMTKNGTWCNYGTADIAANIREAADADNICAIVMKVDSGGGSVDSIAPMRDAIQYAQSKGKPVVANCDLCASAAYYVATYCDEIMADNDISSAFGSIGVMAQYEDDAKQNENDGIKMHVIYSTLSSEKNKPYNDALAGDYTTAQKELLDPMAAAFQNQVKTARKKLDTKCDGILSGKVFFAKDALANGLIDSIGNLNNAVEHARQRSIDTMMSQYINTIK